MFRNKILIKIGIVVLVLSSLGIILYIINTVISQIRIGNDKKIFSEELKKVKFEGQKISEEYYFEGCSTATAFGSRISTCTHNYQILFKSTGDSCRDFEQFHEPLLHAGYGQPYQSDFVLTRANLHTTNNCTVVQNLLNRKKLPGVYGDPSYNIFEYKKPDPNLGTTDQFSFFCQIPKEGELYDIDQQFELSLRVPNRQNVYGCIFSYNPLF